MTANSSIKLTSLDFDSNKEALKSFLKQQTQFKDYNFDDSNLNVLLDLLAYNTYQTGFYLNMIGNEMFLDSAQLRDSVISHAKELNYLPRSFTSAKASVDIVVEATDDTLNSIVIPKGTGFLSRVGNKTYTFTTNENITVSSGNNTYVAANTTIYEGIYLSDTYAVNYEAPLVYKITNRRADISSVTVTVIEDNGANQIDYRRATSLFDKDETSEIFFLHPAGGDTYEVVFGDGVIGKRPKDNSIIVIEYRVSNGELPNGASTFLFTGKIDGQSDVRVNTVSAATGGEVAESLESIKFNAPRAFTTQERAVTAEDYENLLKVNFPEINAVSAYGGEEVNPPRFGKVFVSVDLEDIDGLPQFKREEYTRFLKSRSSLAIEPIFVSPQYTYLGVNSNVKYNINVTNKNPDDIRTSVLAAILNYAKVSLNNFNRTMRYSKIVNAIDGAELSIVSNETDIQMIKYLIPELNTAQNFLLDFDSPIVDDIPLRNAEYDSSDRYGVTSTRFTFAGTQNCNLEDDGNGGLIVVTTSGDTHIKIADVGSVDYENGIVQINDFMISSFVGNILKVYAVPRNKDIISSQNVILNILESDTNITIEQIRE